MQIMGFNVVAVAVAAVAGFAFGAIYYTVLGKQWMDAVGLAEEDVQKRSPVPFIVSFVGLLVLGCVLSWHFSQQGGSVSSSYAIHSSLILWFGLIVTSTATNNAFQQSKPKLTVIDSLHWLGVLVIQGLVISAF